jgi:hypothetical protein
MGQVRFKVILPEPRRETARATLDQPSPRTVLIDLLFHGQIEQVDQDRFVGQSRIRILLMGLPI